MSDKCFCHLNGYAVKDATARKDILNLSDVVNIIKASIDVIGKLPEGSTTMDAAVEDIKIGYDGKTRATPGDSVREQFMRALAIRDIITASRPVASLSSLGMYYYTNDAAAATSDYPSDRGGIVLVMAREDRTSVCNILVDARGDLYYRFKTSTEWGKWNKTATDAQVTELEKLAQIEHHTDGIGPLVEIAETYFNAAFNSGRNLVYESGRGLFADNVKNDSGVNAIVCSQFVQACIAGIAYSYSRYVGKPNIRRSWGFVSDGSGTYSFTGWNPHNDYMDAGNQAEYFEGLGELKIFDVNRNALKPGDLLFYTKEGSEHYKSISHVAICLAADDKKHIIMHSSENMTKLIDGKETGVSVNMFTYERYAPAYYVRSPISAEYKTIKLHDAKPSAFGSYEAGAESKFIYNIAPEAALSKGFYTIHFDDQGDSETGYIKIVYENGTEQNVEGLKQTGIWNVVFYAEMPVSSIQVRVANGTWSGTTRVQLHKGYHAEMII